MKSKKILILVMNSDLYPSKTIVPVLKKTFLSKSYIQLNLGQYEFPNLIERKDKFISYLIFQGGSTKIKYFKNTLLLNHEKDLKTQPDRVLDCFEWILENVNFDYIYRTTTTAYLNIEKLYEFVLDKPISNFYAAPEMFHEDKRLNKKIRFGSGAGFFLSRDLLTAVINNRDKWDKKYLDDVSLGKLLLEDLRYDLVSTPRQDFKKYPLNKDIDFDQFHYRFRLDLYGYPRFLEPLVVIGLHLKINYQKNPEMLKKIIYRVYDLFSLLLFFIAKKLYFLPKYKVAVKKIKFFLKKFPLLIKIKKIFTN